MTLLLEWSLTFHYSFSCAELRALLVVVTREVKVGGRVRNGIGEYGTLYIPAGHLNEFGNEIIYYHNNAL